MTIYVKERAIVDARQATIDETIQTDEGPILVLAGEWIIKNNKTKLSKIDNNQFNVLYRRFPTIDTLGGASVIDSAGPLELVNSVAETALYSLLVPANRLGTSGKLEVVFFGDYLNNSLASRTLTLKISFGTAVLYQDALVAPAINTLRRPFYMSLWLVEAGTTNSQLSGGFMSLGTPGGATVGLGDAGSVAVAGIAPFIGIDATQDTTVDKTLTITAQWSLAATTLSFKRRGVVVTKS